MTPTTPPAVSDARTGESGKTMPIMLSSGMSIRKTRREQFLHVASVPWELFGEHGERMSQRNHSQSLERIAQRGGFDAVEAVCVLTGASWQTGQMSEDQAHRVLYAMTAFYRRGVLAGKRETTS